MHAFRVSSSKRLLRPQPLRARFKAVPSLQIRNLPDDVYQALAYRAERAHRSLAQQAVVELRDAMADTGQRQRILEQVARRIAAHGALEPRRKPEDLVRDDRER